MITLAFFAIALGLIGLPTTAMVLIGRKVAQPRPAKPAPAPASFNVHAGQACQVGTCVCAGCLDARWLDSFGHETEQAMAGRRRWIGGGSDA